MIARNSRPRRTFNDYHGCHTGCQDLKENYTRMKLFTTVLAALALTTGFALAADEKPAAGKADKPKRNPEEVFKKLDANSDGSITAEEFKAGPMAKRAPDRADKFFKNHDKDSDGKLTLDEYKARPAKKGKAQ